MNNTTLKRMRRYTMIYVMLIPIAIYFIVFSYYPLCLGIFNSFMESKLLGGAKYVGARNYGEVLHNPLYINAFVNTFIVGCVTFMVRFGLGLLIALSVNELKNKFAKSTIQSTTYLPYLLSWSVVGGMWVKLLSATGLINGIMSFLAGSNYKAIIFMAEPRYARSIMVLTGAWKEAGYFAVLFLAAVVSIDESIYEAASIDGASRLTQIIKITVPNLAPTMKVIAVLGSMSVLRNFDQIFVMGNPIIYDKIRNLLFIIYQDGVVGMKIGLATAAATLVLLATFIISFAVRKLTKYDANYS